MLIKFIKRVIHNWHIKLLSLALAAILWVYVDNLKERERFFSIPLEVRNVPSHHMVSNDLPGTVKVVLKGKESSLALVNEKSLEAYVDFEQRARARSRNIIRVDKESLPRGVTVKEINPAAVEAEVEVVRRKRVKVVPVIFDEPPFGYQLENVEVEPNDVEIRGPVSLVDSIESVYTVDIDVSGITETTIKSVDINLDDDKISLIDNRPVSVKAVVKELYVVERVEEIPIVPVKLNVELRALLPVSSISALVRIPKRMEKGLTREMVVAVVDFTDVNSPGVFYLPVVVRAKIDGVSFINFEPRSVEVTVEKEEVPRINL
jgi:YbbR domain-containing protein